MGFSEDECVTVQEHERTKRRKNELRERKTDERRALNSERAKIHLANLRPPQM